MSTIARGSPALAIWNAIACVPVMLASARVLLLMVQSTAKQRERGGSYFAFPLAMAALSSVLGGSIQLFRVSVSLTFYNCNQDGLRFAEAVPNCFAVFSLTFFMLGWMRAAALASHGIGATNPLWIKLFPVVILVHCLAPFLDFLLKFTNCEEIWCQINFHNTCVLLVVTMPFVSFKLRGLSKSMGPTSGQVVARLLSLSRIARNSAVVGICVAVLGAIVVIIQAVVTPRLRMDWGSSTVTYGSTTDIGLCASR